MRLWTLCLVPLFSLAACSRPTPPTPDPSTSTPGATPQSTEAASPRHSGPRNHDGPRDHNGPHERAKGPEVGQPAPDFTLQDYEGKSHHLADLRGKTVVLEWFNPNCPFVKASHNKGSLKELAKNATAKNVVWLAINSSAPGKEGNGAEAVTAGKKAFGLTHPILVDESGQVGHLYGATNTPDMFVIDDKGVLVYKGAIDNSPDGEGESPTGGKLVNYVQSALDAIAAGKPVEVKETRPYGCGVKYGS